MTEPRVLDCKGRELHIGSLVSDGTERCVVFGFEARHEGKCYVATGYPDGTCDAYFASPAYPDEVINGVPNPTLQCAELELIETHERVTEAG